MNAKFFALFFLLSVNHCSVYAESASNTSPKQATSLTSSQINLNKADLKALTGSFKGIGKKRAEAIIAYRESHQGFKSLEELAEVKGIGPHFVEANRDALKKTFTIN